MGGILMNSYQFQTGGVKQGLAVTSDESILTVLLNNEAGGGWNDFIVFIDQRTGLI